MTDTNGGVIHHKDHGCPYRGCKGYLVEVPGSPIPFRCSDDFCAGLFLRVLPDGSLPSVQEKDHWPDKGTLQHQFIGHAVDRCWWPRLRSDRATGNELPKDIVELAVG